MWGRKEPSVTFTIQEASLLIGIAANADPDRYTNLEVKAAILKAKATKEMSRETGDSIWIYIQQ